MDAVSSSPLELPQQFRQFTISEIHLATQNFDASLVIGRGGFGIVYKGIVTNGANRLVVAIKRLDSTSNQGAAEFWNEVQMLSNLRHCHLVSLIGYCSDGQEMILVYEYMPHGTLEDHLHKFQSSITWVRRLKICIGAARGLDYLHTGTGIKHGIIHRDVKSSNILLDDSWAAKISDFGLSKLGPINQPSTYVNTFVKGTFGYLDPDYFATGRLTRKSDVYAFGVVLLEVLSGKHAVDSSLDEEHWGLVNWVQESIREGRLKQIVDCNIRERILPKCLKEFARLAEQCLHSNPKQRPTMFEVVVCLESVLASQEKANDTLHPAGMRIFGNKVPMFRSWPNGEKSGTTTKEKDTMLKIAEERNKVTQNSFPSPALNLDATRKKSGWTKRSLELYFDTIGGENKILRRFEFRTINIATENFSENNKVSQWRDGSMYKGRLQNGLDISIARHDSVSRSQDYKNEVALLVELEHENLLKLLGYSIEGTQVFLVYEFALFSTLDCMLFDPECTQLDWNTRNKILLAVARALLSLHQNDVIHSNVNPGNILLDESMHPKLSVFGLARLLPVDHADDCVEVDIEVDVLRRTSGDGRRYLAPEYSSAGQLSPKTDVYSFGVLILETISGYRIFDNMPTSNITLIEHVWTNWSEGSSSYIIDNRIYADSSSITRFINIGLLCIQTYPADRPTMEEVIGMLTNSSSLTLPIPTKSTPHWMLEEYSVDADAFSTAAVCGDAAYTNTLSWSNGEKSGTTTKEKDTMLKIAEERNKVTQNSFPSPALNLDATRKKSGWTKRSLELYFDTIGGENKILRRFEFRTINIATENFSENNKVSQWRDGSMYKGRLQNGLDISIARHDSVSRSQDYKNEVALLVELEHENLLKLLGYSIEGTQVFLVYEFALFSTLDCMLFDPECTQLDWNTRNKILLAVARALLSLHQNDVIHSNVNPGNILLDESMHPKLSVFGLARLLPVDHADDCVEVDIEVDVLRRTSGDGRRYLAPEYSSAGQLSPKTDVYSFGVLILETISGYRIFDNMPTSNITLIEHVWTNWSEGSSSYIIDNRIYADSSSITRFINIGLLCIQTYPADRPTMEEVIGMLTNSSSLTLPIPTKSTPHWMLEEYSVDADAFSTAAVCGDAAYTNTLSWSNGEKSGTTTKEKDTMLKIAEERNKVTQNSFPSPALNLDATRKKSGWSKRSLELYFDTIGSENNILSRFEFETIKVATENFFENNKISRWGYHGFTMYKGSLQSGQGVSIAIHNSGSGSQGYINEVALLVKLEHENLLKLLGYCIEGTQVFLVYEFAVCESLDHVLFDRGCTLLDWNKRNKIILAVARVLLYLHQHDVMHVNVRPGNILLDKNFDPKLSDFGLAKCLPLNEFDSVQVDANMHQDKQLSTKDDVYRFGVLILETMTGYNIHYFTAQRTLLQVWRDWWLGKDRNIIDHRIHADLSVTARIILIGLVCISKDAADRPTMEEVVAMLTNKNLPIQKLPMPPWIIGYDSDYTIDRWGRYIKQWY